MTPIREAGVRHEVGQRLFHEGKYRDAAAEFEMDSTCSAPTGIGTAGSRSQNAQCSGPANLQRGRSRTATCLANSPERQ